jgi:hypothetical protein
MTLVTYVDEDMLPHDQALAAIPHLTVERGHFRTPMPSAEGK